MVARWPVSLLALALLCPAPVGLGAQARGQDARPGIAVFPFDNGGSYGQNKDNFDALQKGIAGLMISDLAANPPAGVGEGEERRKWLDGRTLGTPGGGDPQTPARIGKLGGGIGRRKAGIPVKAKSG